MYTQASRLFCRSADSDAGRVVRSTWTCMYSFSGTVRGWVFSIKRSPSHRLAHFYELSYDDV